MSDNETFVLEEASDEESPGVELEIASASEEETAPEPEPVPIGTVAEEPSKIARTKTGRIKKKASPRTRERLKAQLAKGRAKSLEIRRRNKKLKDITKRKKIDEEDEFLLKELQERKSNHELQEEIRILRDQLKAGKVPAKDLELPPKPKKQTAAPIAQQPQQPPQPERKIKSMLPGGFSLKQLRGL